MRLTYFSVENEAPISIFRFLVHWASSVHQEVVTPLLYVFHPMASMATTVGRNLVVPSSFRSARQPQAPFSGNLATPSFSKISGLPNKRPAISNLAFQLIGPMPCLNHASSSTSLPSLGTYRTPSPSNAATTPSGNSPTTLTA